MAGCRGRVVRAANKVALALLTVVLAGCAAAPSRHPDFVPDRIKAVYVFSVMAPRDADRVAKRMTGEMSRLLLGQRKVYPVDQISLADGLIEVRIDRLFLEPVSRNADGKIDKARLICDAVFSFRDRSSRAALLENCRLTGVRKVQLVSQPVSDLQAASDQLADELSTWIIDWCMSGKPPRYNPLFGYEDMPDLDTDGILIGRPRNNRDRNNDGIDDALQGLTNSSASSQGRW
ncbi:MAG TPA: hypothetical protein PLD82_06110 [Spirochaetota bacterium]|nr:hypothetical protein [Spirochaetota bacterium]